MHWEVIRLMLGMLRETFFFNQTRVLHAVTYSPKVDFILDGTYSFEIGGKNKTKEQLREVPNGYLALDNIEVGYGNQIPLWIFGLMY